MDHQEVQQKLKQKYREMAKLMKHYAGYPCNAKFNYGSILPFLKMPLNNVGDPYSESIYRLNTHEFEEEAIAMLARLYGQDEGFWGYITNGSSEANLCGLHLARERYPDALVMYNEHSHYSVPKAIEITRSESVMLPCDASGELDYLAFEEQIKAIKEKRPIIVMANIGTTMTGAMDDVHRIKAILKQYAIDQYAIHADAALHGLILPFTRSPKKFHLYEVDSFSISGHKFLGSPLPCGVFMSQQKLMDLHQSFVEYVGVNDNTITGSRNAVTPLILWYALNDKEPDELQKTVTDCLALTEYAVRFFKSKGVQAWANPDSPIVVFPKAHKEVIQKWQLATHGDISHIVVMPHITKPIIHELGEDLRG